MAARALSGAGTDEAGRIEPIGRPLPRALIVDDHEVFTQALAVALEARGIATVDRADELDQDAIGRAVDRRRPDVVLVDLNLGDGASGVSLVRDLARREIPVVVVTALDDDRRLGECVEAGAEAVFNKTQPFDDLADLVQRAARRERAMPAEQRERLLAAFRQERARTQVDARSFASLTEREASVLQALIEGRVARQIAAEQFVSEATIRTHIRAVLLKLGVRSQLAAVARARAAGWRYG